MPIVSYNKKLEYSTTEGGSYTKLPYLKEINFPTVEADDIEISNDDSPNFTREYLKGWRDGGEVEGQFEYDADTLETMYELANDDANYWFKITLSDGAVSKFQGYVKSPEVEADLEGSVQVTLTIKVTGSVTFTAGS